MPVTSVATWDQFKLELEVNKAEFGVGEPVGIKVTLTNIGNETAELTFSAKNQKVMFTIFDMNGTEVFGTHFLRFDSDPENKLGTQPTTD